MSIAVLAACATPPNAPTTMNAEAPSREAVVAKDVVSVEPTHAEPVNTSPGTSPGAPPASAIIVEGKPVDGAGLVDVRALELACLADPRALTEPKNVWARFDDVAGKQLVPVGELAFVLLERDPARSLTDPPPLLCRTIASSTVLRAPLVRTREPAARWLVKKLDAGLVPDAAALVQQSAAQKLELSARPRVIVDDAGALIAIALPVGTGTHANANGGE